MAALCSFYSSQGKMNQEHVFALWPSTVSLAVDPVEYRDFSWPTTHRTCYGLVVHIRRVPSHNTHL